MKKKGRAVSLKVGPHVVPSRAACHDATRVSIFALNHHLEPRVTFSYPVQSSSTPGISFGGQKDWHANRDELHDNCKARESRKFEKAKIESFILCPTFLVPRNAKQRRDNYHNPIFTPGFSRVSTRKMRQPEPS